jgi:hypothetical protein
MSTERIVAREPVARNLAAAMNSNGFRLSLISPRRSRTNHRDDAGLDRFRQVLRRGDDRGQVGRHFGLVFGPFVGTLKGRIQAESTCNFAIEVQNCTVWQQRHKRLVKTPKVYFADTGTLCYLAGLKTPEHAAAGPMGGAILETVVVSEIVKDYWNRGVEPQVWFWRTSAGAEVDVVVESEGRLVPVEANTLGHADPWHGAQHRDVPQGSRRSRRQRLRCSPR